MESDHNINTFRDFLQFYNLMSQTCFAHCVDNFSSRDLLDNERACIEKCTNKLIRFNHRTITIYSHVQEKLVTKRLKELEEQAQQEQQKLAFAENSIVVAENSIVEAEVAQV